MKFKGIRLSIAGVLLMSLGFLFSCDQLDDELDSICKKSYDTIVTNVEGKHTGTTGNVVALKLSLQADKPCSELGSFKVDVEGKTWTLDPILEYRTCGDCQGNSGTLEVNYDFITGVSGNYTLRFKSGSSDYISYQINIQ